MDGESGSSGDTGDGTSGNGTTGGSVMVLDFSGTLNQILAEIYANLNNSDIWFGILTGGSGGYSIPVYSTGGGGWGFGGRESGEGGSGTGSYTIQSGTTGGGQGYAGSGYVVGVNGNGTGQVMLANTGPYPPSMRPVPPGQGKDGSIVIPPPGGAYIPPGQGPDGSIVNPPPGHTDIPFNTYQQAPYLPPKGGVFQNGNGNYVPPAETPSKVPAAPTKDQPKQVPTYPVKPGPAPAAPMLPPPFPPDWPYNQYRPGTPIPRGNAYPFIPGLLPGQTWPSTPAQPYIPPPPPWPYIVPQLRQ